MFVFCVCSGICRPFLRAAFTAGAPSYTAIGERAQLCTVQIMADMAGVRSSEYVKRCVTVCEDECFYWRVVGDGS